MEEKVSEREVRESNGKERKVCKKKSEVGRKVRRKRKRSDKERTTHSMCVHGRG